MYLVDMKENTFTFVIMEIIVLSKVIMLKTLKIETYWWVISYVSELQPLSGFLFAKILLLSVHFSETGAFMPITTKNYLNLRLEVSRS